MDSITIEVPVDVAVPEGAEEEARQVASAGASAALRQHFALPKSQARLESLLGKIGTFEGRPRTDGKAWSEMETPCESDTLVP